MNEIICEQRSDEWFKARLGKLTGSKFPKLMPTPRQRTEWNDTQLGILRECAAEIMTGEREETFQSAAMAWGNDHEDEAREAYEMLSMETVRTCGFFQHSEYIGSSPDGIIGDMKGVWECKCPTPKQHLRYFLDPAELWKDYKWQVVGHMLATGIHSGLIMSYDPRYPEHKQIAIYRPTEGPEIETAIAELQARLDSAVTIIKEWVA